MLFPMGTLLWCGVTMCLVTTTIDLTAVAIGIGIHTKYENGPTWSWTLIEDTRTMIACPFIFTVVSIVWCLTGLAIHHRYLGIGMFAVGNPEPGCY